MSVRAGSPIAVVGALMAAALLLGPGCYPNAQPPGLSPVPTLPAGMTPTPAPEQQTPLGQTPTLFIPQSMGQEVPLVPGMQTAVPPATVVSPAPVPVAADQVSAAAGATLYNEGCLCHGPQGQGVSAPALRDSQYIQVAGEDAIYTVIAYGRQNTRMPAWLLGQCGPMTSQQIQSVVGYLMQGLQGVPTLATATPSAPVLPGATPSAQPIATPSPGAGQALQLAGTVDAGRAYFGPYCAGCHGPEGLQGIPNPGAEDTRVPLLNPIAPDIASTDTAVFAGNLYERIQYGRVPAGPAPEIVMPAFGERNLLSQQQIADIMAYVIYLNRNCPGLSCG